MNAIQMRRDGEARKSRSIARLHDEGVPTIEHLPWIACDPAMLQCLESVARRTIVITLLAARAENNGMPRDVLQHYLDLRGVRGDLTANERIFVDNATPSEKQRGPFTWQYECAHVLLWALGYVKSLGRPAACCTAKGVTELVAPRSLPQLMEDATSRSANEIFDETDLIYRYNWAAREAHLCGQEVPAGLNSAVCYYRHHALNWLVDSATNWDDVDTST